MHKNIVWTAGEFRLLRRPLAGNFHHPLDV